LLLHAKEPANKERFRSEGWWLGIRKVKPFKIWKV